MEAQNGMGAFIAALRHGQGVTQAQLAAQLGVTDRAVSKWETGAGLPDVAVLPTLAAALAVSVDELLAGSRAAAPGDAPLCTAAFLRTQQARSAQALCLRWGGARFFSAVLAALCPLLALLVRVVWQGAAGAVGTAFFVCAAAFFLWDCADGPQRLRLRRACGGDFSAAPAAVYPAFCRWRRGAFTFEAPHTALRRVWELPEGFVLQWGQTMAFAARADEAAVRCLLARTGAVCGQRRRSRLAVWAACACALSAAAALWLGQLPGVLPGEAGDAAHAVQTAPWAPQDNASALPYFGAGGQYRFAATGEGVWYTPDGGETAFSPGETRAVFSGTGSVLAEETGPAAQGVLYAEDELRCSVSVTQSEGSRWENTLLVELFRPAAYAKLAFPTAQFGYAALGTAYSMGAGEEKRAFFTQDGGVSWTEPGPLPRQGTSSTLCGFAMDEGGTAALTLTTPAEENWPLLYVSPDAGATWKEAQLPWEDTGLPWLFGLDALEVREDGIWLCMTQAPHGGGTAAFRADAPGGPWTYAGAGIPGVG